MVSEGDDFEHVFGVFDRWALRIVNDFTAAVDQDVPISLPWEEDFVVDIIDDLEFCLSPIPLQITTAMNCICLRHIYRQMIEQAEKIWSLGGIHSDVYVHRMFRWVLDCAMSSSLEIGRKNRISTWMQSCGLDRVLASENPVGVMIPGQRVMSRISVAWGLFDQPQTEEVFWEFEDVGFEPCGPTLHPISYATPVTDFSSLEGEVCNVCVESLADNSHQAVKIDICGHFVHHGCLSALINNIQKWSNKCPACRQQIWPPRAKRALVCDEVEEDESDEGWEEDDEYQESEDEEIEDRNEDTVQIGTGDEQERENTTAVMDMGWSGLLGYLCF